MDTAYTFDDLYIIPRYSEIESRSDVNLQTRFTRNFNMDIPLIAAPMDSVCGSSMAFHMSLSGGVGCIHRFCSIEEQLEMLEEAQYPILHSHQVFCAAIGVNGDFEERADALVSGGATVLLIDIAHGHHIAMKRALALLNNKSWRSNVDIIAGNIATIEAARDLESWGADALRVGIGGGSMCTTRVMTGVGVPQLQTIIDIAPNVNIPVISDGGIRSPGDVAKCLAAGADSVMIGNLFSGCNESPGDVFTTGVFPNERRQKVYQGSASMSAKSANGKMVNNIEGTAHLVDAKGPIKNVVETILDGVRSSMSYTGSQNLEHFHTNARFNRVTTAGLIEAHPHGAR